MQTAASDGLSAAAPDRFDVPAVAWWLGIALLCTAVSLRPINDPDIWFQLLVGRHVLDQGSVPHGEFFLYTAGADAWQLFGGWGFGVLAELAVRLAGFGGLSFFCALLWASTLMLGLLAVRRATLDGAARPGRLDWGFAAGASVALLVAYQGFVHRSDLRAEVTLYLAWMAATLLLESGQRPAERRRALLAFPLLCLALAWLHTTVLLMLPLLAAYALRRWMGRKAESVSVKEILWWAGCALASVTLPLLNPNGAPQVFGQVGLWMGTAASGNNAAETLVNLEYVPLLDPRSAFMWPALIVLAIGTGIWLVLAGPARLPGLVTIVPMAILAFQHRRGVGLWAMALLVPLACALVETFRQRMAGRRRPLIGLAVGSLALLAISVLPTSHWGVGLADGSLKGGRVLKELAQRLPQGGNVWAFDGISPQIPYFLGESYKIGYAGHMVNRHSAVARHHSNVMGAVPGWDKELADHGVSMVVTTDMVMPDTQLVPIAWRLGWHPQWELVTVDRQLLVFQRRPTGQPPSPRERWEQAAAVTQHALQMTQASQLYAPDARTVRLGEQLRQQQAALDAARDRPESVDWAAIDRAAGTAPP